MTTLHSLPQISPRILTMPDTLKNALVDAITAPARPAVDRPAKPFDEYTVSAESAICYSKSGTVYRLMVKGEAEKVVYHFCCTAEELYDCERDCPRSALGMRCRHRDDLAEVLNRAEVYSWRLYQFDWSLNIQITDGARKCDPSTAVVIMKSQSGAEKTISFLLDGSIT